MFLYRVFYPIGIVYYRGIWDIFVIPSWIPRFVMSDNPGTHALAGDKIRGKEKTLRNTLYTNTIGTNTI